MLLELVLEPAMPFALSNVPVLKLAGESVLLMMPPLVDLHTSANSGNNVDILSRSTAVVATLATKTWRQNSASNGLRCSWSS